MASTVYPDLCSMTIKARDFDKVINKFGFQTKSSHHILAWLEYDGKVVVRTKRSHTPKNRDLPAEYSIRSQMKLTTDQFREAEVCTLSKEDYINILRDKGTL